MGRLDDDPVKKDYKFFHGYKILCVSYRILWTDVLFSTLLETHYTLIGIFNRIEIR